MKWEHMGGDLILVRQWQAEESTTEDALDTVPQRASMHNILGAMWGEEAIGRIASKGARLKRGHRSQCT